MTAPPMTFELPPRKPTGRISLPDKMWNACDRVMRQGESRDYGEAHLVARWVLGLYRPEPVYCNRCGVSDIDMPPTCTSQMHAALNWEQAAAAGRLRVQTTHAGRARVFSMRPDLDYIPLCHRCHSWHDSWRRALALSGTDLETV